MNQEYLLGVLKDIGDRAFAAADGSNHQGDIEWIEQQLREIHSDICDLLASDQREKDRRADMVYFRQAHGDDTIR